MQNDSAFLKRRSAQLFKAETLASSRRTDRLFALLLPVQWLAGIGIAAWLGPSHLAGRTSVLSVELYTAIFLGLAILAPALFLIFKKPGKDLTRHVVAVCQMLFSALLVHLSGGRLETHFHVFASLVLLSFYRDWKVMVTAAILTIADQFVLAMYFPRWIFDTAQDARWRWLEHAGWIVVADVCLIFTCLHRSRERAAIIEGQAELEETRTSVERTVVERLALISQNNRDLNRQMSERQRAEQDSRAAREALEVKLREKAAELGAANRALKRQADEGKRTEDELARSIQRYRFMTDSVPQIVWTATPEGQIDYSNRRFHEYTGMSAEEIGEWGWQPAIHPDDVERCSKVWTRSVLSGEIYEVDCRLRRGSDGAYRWHLSRALPWYDPDGKIVQWFGTCTDIDDQRRSREAIKRSEQRYRSLVSASAQIVWLTDADGRVAVDMPEFRAATGQSFEETLGLGWLNAIHPDDRERATQLWQQAVASSSVYENEFRLRMHDGAYRNFSTRGVPVMEADGRVREWIGTMADITERRAAEEVLLRAQEDLEARVRERTAQLTDTNRILHQQVIERKQIEGELAEARDDALRSARLKSEFLANMSHEIRTPMNGVIGMTSLLLDTQLDEEQREYIETIRASGDALLSIINDILDFSKIEAGKLDFEQLDFDLQSTVEGAIELLAEKAQAKGLDLACHVLEDVPRQLRGDSGRLRQVLVNLVGNAVKFTPSGRVLVHVAKLQETATDTQICFQVSDTGIGLTEEAARGLFQAFVQADGSMTRKFGGTGLGLAISKQLVELMGGQIGVESAPDQGSTFWFTVGLPKQAILFEDDEAAAAEETDFSSAHTLIVGSSGTGEVLREQLVAWGMRTAAVTTAEEALVAMREAAAGGQPFNFALVDTRLPDMDGQRLARTIKGDAKIANAGIVMLLAPGQRASANYCQSSEISACLAKPVKRSQLRDYFRSALAAPAAVPSGRKALKTGAPAALPRPVKRGRTHVLVVEDNQVNQKVIIRQLEKIGYKADAVGNGIEALEATAKVAFDAILMDCQMPEMDGFTATRHIRQREKGTGVHSPIIALTANALEGDREKCLDAGMDDYLSKPVKIEALQATLEKWTAVEPADADSARRPELETAAA